jgi:hypothetical protein
MRGGQGLAGGGLVNLQDRHAHESAPKVKILIQKHF